MMLIVLASNYLVQFQFNFLNLQNILTWGAFTYPIAFLVTDIANRIYGLSFAKKIIIIGFIWGVFISSLFSLKAIDLISIRIVVGSGIAFLLRKQWMLRFLINLEILRVGLFLQLYHHQSRHFSIH